MLSLTSKGFIYTAKQFAFWRIAFGFYLAFYYFRLLPYSAELYSSSGAFSDRHLFAFRHTLFPSFFLIFDSPIYVHAMNLLGITFGLMIMLGTFRRTAAFFLCLLAMWFLARNHDSDSPELGFVNWLVFALIFIPEGEPYSSAPLDPGWRMPPAFYWGAWVVLVVGYFYAGITKLSHGDPSWRDGTAMYYVINKSPPRFGWYGNLFSNLPMPLFKFATYAALLMQTLAFVFIAFRASRPWWWLTSTLTHVSLLFLMNLAQLTWGMILFQMFLIDSNWFGSTFGPMNPAPAPE